MLRRWAQQCKDMLAERRLLTSLSQYASVNEERSGRRYQRGRGRLARAFAFGRQLMGSQQWPSPTTAAQRLREETLDYSHETPELVWNVCRRELMYRRWSPSGGSVCMGFNKPSSAINWKRATIWGCFFTLCNKTIIKILKSWKKTKNKKTKLIHRKNRRLNT